MSLVNTNLRIFKVSEDEKCGGCNWKTSNVYLLAENEKEAKNLYKKSKKGLCAECLVGLLK